MADDAHLVARARTGDTEAWRALYAQHAGVVRRSCSSFASLSKADVEDAVQETFVRAFRSLGDLRDAARFRPWLLAIARTTCLERLHKSAAETRTAFAWANDPTARAPNDARELAQRERRIALVRRLIEELPEGEQRETVRMFYVEGSMSASEIAERLGVGKSTVTMRLERFRARVKRRIAAELARLEEQQA
jgi:RNA polymerase sigma-70 factor, ECF subfamily